MHLVFSGSRKGANVDARLSDDGCLTYALLRAASKMERIPSAIVMEFRSCLLVIPDLLLRVSTIAAYPRALLLAN